jgi:pyrroline-5-carboxylate reductase
VLVISTDNTLGIIGGGNMGEAFIGAMIKSKIFSADKIFVNDIDSGRLDHLKNRYGVALLSDNAKVFNTCRVVILAVKPQQMSLVLSEIINQPDYAISDRKLVVSIAAGITLGKIESMLYSNLKDQDKKKIAIIRIMPNTPALVLEGMSGMSPNDHSQPEDIRFTRAMLEAMGSVLEFKEKQLNAVTGLSGSGPAYVFYLIEAMIQAGIKVGLDPEDSKFLTLKTHRGAIKLMEESNESAENLRRKVTSPGGTTEAALKVLETRQVKIAFIEAIAAATRRAEELSQ